MDDFRSTKRNSLYVNAFCFQSLSSYENILCHLEQPLIGVLRTQKEIPIQLGQLLIVPAE